MIRSLAWKEYREHQTVWVAMAGLASFLVVALTQVYAPNGVATAHADKLQPVALAALILAGTYGLVCGAMMVAGEREARTQAFLDALPAGRIRIWMTKLLMGALFTLAHALVVTGVLIALGLTEVKTLPAGWQLALPVVGLEAFVYGLFGSALGRSVLAAFGWASVPVTVIWLICGAHLDWPPSAPLLAVRLTFLLLVLGTAGLLFCRPDLQRMLGDSPDFAEPVVVKGQGGWRNDEVVRLSPRHHLTTPPPHHLTTPPPYHLTTPQSWEVLIWLAWRQGWARFLLMAGLSLVLGLLLPNAALAIWPVATLLVGVVFGTGMFSGDQPGESYRFLGNQRLPMGRVWIAKTVAWSGMAAGAIILILLGTAVHLALNPAQQIPGGRYTRGEDFLGSRLLAYLPKDVFLLLWPVYGFGIGQFLSLVCRKSAVALVLSLLVSVAVVSPWLPSLVGGGLKLWQVLPVPALLLLSTRLTLWSWAGEGSPAFPNSSLGTRGPAVRFIDCGILAAVWMVGTLFYRAVEVPDLGEPFEVQAFVAGLPTLEQNEAGRLVRRAVQELAEQERQIDEEFKQLHPPPLADMAEIPGGAPMAPPLPGPHPTFQNVLETGWPEEDGELGQWLDRICQGEWIGHLREAAALPRGVVDDPRQLYAFGGLQVQAVYHRAAVLLAARALQLQARGDHALALDHLVCALALSRNLRHAAVRVNYLAGQAVESTALRGFDRWLDRLGPRPDLLQRVLNELGRHEERTPPPTDPIKAEYLLLRERLEDPARWLDTGPGYSATAGLENDLITLALQTPWEKERAMRILNTLTSSRLTDARTPYWQIASQKRVWDRSNGPAEVGDLGSNPPLRPVHWQRPLTDSRLVLQLFVLSARPQHLAEALSLCQVRGAQLKVALALYQLQEGKSAPALAHLVPHYLAELPEDPFSGRSFHYHVSTGERIGWRRESGDDRPPWIEIPAGQGILWSVGPAGVESGGMGGRTFQDAEGREFLATGSALIFIVPAWRE